MGGAERLRAVERVLAAVRAAVREHRMLAPGDKVLVGVSGGPDSLVLAHSLWSLREELGVSLHVAHLNHMIRPEADEEAEAVRRFAGRLGLPVTVGAVPVGELARAGGLSLEEAGREARYRFFRDVRQAVGAGKLALGHNRDDQAETVLMRLVRGAGPAGLAGIPPVREGWIIRPLIEVPRAHIEAYCREAGLEPVQDPSNRSPAHLRNRVRWELIPLLEERYNPRIREVLHHLAATFRDEEEWLRPLVDEAFSRCARQALGTVAVDVAAFASCPKGLRRRLVRRAAALARGDAAYAPPFEHVEACLRLAGMPVGKRLELPEGVAVWRDYGAIVFARKDRLAARPPFRYRLEVPGALVVEEAGVRLEAELARRPPPADGRSVAVFDADLVGGVVEVRNRRPGDRFHPLGLGASKKLKEYFINEKVSRRERDLVPLVVIPGAGERDDTIIWVVGHRPDARFQPGPDTRRYLVLRSFVFKNPVC